MNNLMKSEVNALFIILKDFFFHFFSSPTCNLKPCWHGNDKERKNSTSRREYDSEQKKLKFILFYIC